MSRTCRDRCGGAGVRPDGGQLQTLLDLPDDLDNARLLRGLLRTCDALMAIRGHDA